MLRLFPVIVKSTCFVLRAAGSHSRVWAEVGRGSCWLWGWVWTGEGRAEAVKLACGNPGKTGDGLHQDRLVEIRRSQLIWELSGDKANRYGDRPPGGHEDKEKSELTVEVFGFEPLVKWCSCFLSWRDWEREEGLGSKSKSSIWVCPPLGLRYPLEFQMEKSGKMFGQMSLESRGDVWAEDIPLEAISIWRVFKGRRLNEII